MKAKELDTALVGAKYRSTHRASIMAILGDEAPTVISKGSSFYNQDRWTGRTVVTAMCDWARTNKGTIPTVSDIKSWVDKANSLCVPNNQREIVIASTPDVLPAKTAMALIGGAYHEALHTKYSCRRDLTVTDMAEIVVSRWSLIKDWSPYTKALLDWSNIVEDIKIERRGCEVYEGIHSRMCDLHDMVLDIEEPGRLKSLLQPNAPSTTLTVIMCAFRDIGKGYETDQQQVVNRQYEQINSAALKFVTDGQLTSLVGESTSLTDEDDLGSLRLAMDVLIKLDTLSNSHVDHKSADDNQSKSKDGDAEETDEEIDKKDVGSDLGKQQEENNEEGDNEIPGTSDTVATGTDKTDKANSQPDDGQNDDEKLAKEATDQIKSGSGSDNGVKDVNDALNEVIKAVIDREDRKVHKGEAPWRPYDTSNDVIEVVKPSKHGKVVDTEKADAILKTVQMETAFLRSRLRTLVRSLEMTGTTRGVERGRVLSSRYLVDTKVTVMDGVRPRRAFDTKGEIIDLSMACAIVLDESGSMSSLKYVTSRVLMALVEPLDSLNAATMVVGFGDAGGGSIKPLEDLGTYHRSTSVRYDIFKKFDERFKPIRWRFANIKAGGGTPMADGVQIALSALSSRAEAHRFLFVITDGRPNEKHVGVMNFQMRIAKEAGIHVIGVGIGYASKYVQTTFNDSVWSDLVSELPKLLVAKLNEFIDVQATKRGRIARGVPN